ncbi:MAG: sigma factor-like helix-turn-helix DNA-binding protein [Eubacteriales bacterium]
MAPRRPRPEDTLRKSHRHHKLRPHPRERKIITLRYGLNGDAPITQRETAERLKISRSYVSRIEAAALAKLAERL